MCLQGWLVWWKFPQGTNSTTHGCHACRCMKGYAKEGRPPLHVPVPWQNHLEVGPKTRYPFTFGQFIGFFFLHLWSSRGPTLWKWQNFGKIVVEPPLKFYVHFETCLYVQNNCFRNNDNESIAGSCFYFRCTDSVFKHLGRLGENFAF